MRLKSDADLLIIIENLDYVYYPIKIGLTSRFHSLKLRKWITMKTIAIRVMSKTFPKTLCHKFCTVGFPSNVQGVAYAGFARKLSLYLCTRQSYRGGSQIGLLLIAQVFKCNGP